MELLPPRKKRRQMIDGRPKRRHTSGLSPPKIGTRICPGTVDCRGFFLSNCTYKITHVRR